MLSAGISYPALLLSCAAAALRAAIAPGAAVYPCRARLSSFWRSSISVFFTFSGVGTLGFPMLKSKTFSLPISLRRASP